MSLRQVLTIYNAERQLNEDDVALLNTLRRLNDNDREMLVQGLSDKPQKKSTERTIEHCAACDYTRRAKVHKDATVSGYHEFQPSGKKPAGKGGGGKGDQCIAPLPNMNGKICGALRDNPIHEPGQTASYHQFQSSRKSVRGESLKGQLDKTLQGQRKATADDGDNEYERCQAERGEGRTCYLLPDHNVHHLQNAVGYHPFVSYASRAEEQSSASSAATNSTASSVMRKDAASNVHHAGG